MPLRSTVSPPGSSRWMPSAGKLIDMPPKPQHEATFSTSMGTSDFLDPVFAFDGNDATYFQSAVPPKTGDHFTVAFPQPKQVYAIEVLSGVNHRGELQGGEVQVSVDGSKFATVAQARQGYGSCGSQRQSRTCRADPGSNGSKRAARRARDQFAVTR